MRAPATRSVLALAVALAAAVSGAAAPSATAADHPAPAAVSTSDQSRPAHLPAPSIPQRYLDQKIDWQLCTFDPFLKQEIPGIKDTVCAQVKVPMDWQNPDAHPDIELSVAYTPASGTSLGMLTSNPGGPGGSGRTLTHSLALGKHELAAKYDLMSFDPRGFGTSTNVRCSATKGEIDAVPATTDYRKLDANTFKVQEAEARFYAKACSKDEVAPFVNTQQTVYDMDFLRALKGSAKLHYIGYSYGTWLGAWYADTFPQHVGRAILDSNTNWTVSMKEAFGVQPRGFERRRDQMFFPWVARHDAAYHLGRTGASVHVRYESIRAQVARNAEQGTLPGPSDMDFEIAMMMYVDANFPVAAQRMTQWETFAKNPASGLPPVTNQGLAANPLLTSIGAPRAEREALAGARASAADPDEVVDLGASGTVVRCNDSTWPRSTATYIADWFVQRSLYPFIGWGFGINTCAYWPYHRDADRRIDLKGSPRMLMFQSEGDPATEYSGGMSAHLKTLRETRLVKVDDEGQHGLWNILGNRCVDAAGDAFLLDGTLPERDVTCGTVPLPDDPKVFPLAGDVVGGVHQRPAQNEGQRTAAELVTRAQSLS